MFVLNIIVYVVLQEGEAALSKEMEDLCAQITIAAKVAADDRLASDREIAELHSLLHAARADSAQVC